MYVDGIDAIGRNKLARIIRQDIGGGKSQLRTDMFAMFHLSCNGIKMSETRGSLIDTARCQQFTDARRTDIACSPV